MAHGLRASVRSSVIVLRTLAWLVAASVPATACFNPDAEDRDAADAADGTAGRGSDGSDGAGDDGTGDGAADDAADDAAGDSSGAGEGGDDDGGEAEQACAEYCSLIDDHCDGELSQYSGTAVCEATCAQIPLGTPDDTLGNTVGCRTFHAVLAARSPEPHCHHAGPAGDGTCGADCESFCSLVLSTCTGDLRPYADADGCIAACQDYPAEPLYSADVPDADTFACRMRHLTLAAVQPEIHCAHLGEDSPVCVD